MVPSLPEGGGDTLSLLQAAHLQPLPEAQRGCLGGGQLVLAKSEHPVPFGQMRKLRHRQGDLPEALGPSPLGFPGECAFSRAHGPGSQPTSKGQRPGCLVGAGRHRKKWLGDGGWPEERCQVKSVVGSW